MHGGYAGEAALSRRSPPAADSAPVHVGGTGINCASVFLGRAKPLGHNKLRTALAKSVLGDVITRKDKVSTDPSSLTVNCQSVANVRGTRGSAGDRRQTNCDQHV